MLLMSICIVLSTMTCPARDTKVIAGYASTKCLGGPMFLRAKQARREKEKISMKRNLYTPTELAALRFVKVLGWTTAIVIGGRFVYLIWLYMQGSPIQ